MTTIKIFVAILIFFSLVDYINCGSTYRAKKRAGEIDWEDHHRKKQPIPNDEESTFQYAWENSLETIKAGWEQFKSGAAVVAEELGNFFAGAPKNVGKSLGKGLRDILSGIADVFLGGTFATIQFGLMLAAGFIIAYLFYRGIRKYCCL